VNRPSRPFPATAFLPVLLLLAASLAAAAAGAQEPAGPATAAEPPATGPQAPPEGGRRAPVDPAQALQELIAEREAGPDGRAELAGPPRRLPLEWEDEETRAAYLAAVREYYAYREDGLRHRRRVFAWQLSSSRVIFVLVVLLVLSGVYFSGVQFHLTLRAWALTAEREAQGRPAGGPGADALGGEVDASLEGLKVRSPVLGVIILALSFLFFYLYIIHVHPIQEIL
jgi:hypothetical protein